MVNIHKFTSQDSAKILYSSLRGRQPEAIQCNFHLSVCYKKYFIYICVLIFN